MSVEYVEKSSRERTAMKVEASNETTKEKVGLARKKNIRRILEAIGRLTAVEIHIDVAPHSCKRMAGKRLGSGVRYKA